MQTAIHAVHSPAPRKRNYILITAMGIAILAILIAISTPNLLRARKAAEQASAYNRAHAEESKAMAGDTAAPAPGAAGIDFRKVVQTVTLDMRVDDPAKTLDRVRALVAKAGGYIEKSELTGWDSTSRSANVVLRVPATQVDAVRRDLRALGQRVDSENVQSSDVTAEYVDLDASLRNFRAEEESYRQIMQRSGSIKDTLAVAQQLADVRGRIERTQAELNVLSKRVEMATITLSLRPELPVSERAFQWHPVRVVREAFLDGMEALAGFADSIIVILFRLPAILLWLGTLVLAAAVAWRAIRWTWRRFFAPAPTTVAAA